jgi:hypothetical protein
VVDDLEVTQIIAALVVAAGALVGVYAGAVYAVHRLSAQLDEERQLAEERLDAEAGRLQMQLDAESDRLDRQLAHDRRMRDRDELRQLLDHVATITGTAFDQVTVFRGTTPVIGFDPADGPEALAQVESREEVRAKAHRFVFELAREGQRLNLRFSPVDPIPEAFWMLRELLIEFLVLIDVDESEWTEEQAGRVEAKLNECGLQNRELILASRAVLDQA